ncbi:MAG: cell wall-binding repeat-containing protein [Actinobacteria bacterium]|nr:cell wall-binding repeat-containing protein [Actinomycetota bacterium]
MATGTAFPDALALSSLAGTEPGPLLLVRSDNVPEAMRTELQRLAPERIVLAGGTGAVSEVALTPWRGRPVRRSYGSRDRTATRPQPR